MAIREIVLYPDAPLTSKALPITDFGPALARLAADMVETMDAYDGVGLAGPQVGVSRRILVMREPESEARCLVNPEILERDGEETAEEGCLSLPHVFAPVTRAKHIRVRAQNEHGEPVEFVAKDLAARIIQHEYDHLDGRVFLDRVDVLTREDKSQEWTEIRRQIRAAATSAAK